MLRATAAAVFLAAAAMLCSCERTRTDPVPRLQSAASPAKAAEKASSLTLTPAADVATVPGSIQAPQAERSWPVDVMQDPDPRVRRFALEQWARKPTESLDLVAAAMVDSEESIRERAEQVFEEALAKGR